MMALRLAKASAPTTLMPKRLSVPAMLVKRKVRSRASRHIFQSSPSRDNEEMAAREPRLSTSA